MDYIYSIQKKKMRLKKPDPNISNNSKLLLHAFFRFFFLFGTTKASWQSHFCGGQFVHVFSFVQCNMQMEVHTDFDCPFDGLYNTILSDMYSNCDKHWYWIRNAQYTVVDWDWTELKKKSAFQSLDSWFLVYNTSSEHIKITSKALTLTKMARCM